MWLFLFPVSFLHQYGCMPDLKGQKTAAVPGWISSRPFLVSQSWPSSVCDTSNCMVMTSHASWSLSSWVSGTRDRGRPLLFAIKNCYYSTAHWHLGDVLVGNNLFVIFAVLDVSCAVNSCRPINHSFLHLFLLYFTHLPRSPQWVDLYQIWCTGSPRGHNQLCRIFCRLVQDYL